MNTPNSPIVVVRNAPRSPAKTAPTRQRPPVAAILSVGIVGLLAFAFFLVPRAPLVSPGAVKTVRLVKTLKERPQRRVTHGTSRTPLHVHQVALRTPVKNEHLPQCEGPVYDNAATEADGLVMRSLEAAKEGRFATANDLAEQALRVFPQHRAAAGAWFLAGYAQQYTRLADEALAQLNNNNDEIELGPRYGRAAFIERNDDVYTLRCRGSNKKFTIQQLNGMNGVRFRITRQFLDNADLPANNLILAAVHHLKSIDETGNYNHANADTCLDAAVARCQKAASRSDVVAEQAKQILELFDWMRGRPLDRDLAMAK